MMKERIDKLIKEIIEEVASDNLKDILSYYKISAFSLPSDSIILNEIGACYIRSGENKVIWYSDKLINKDFAIAHELAHMILHDDMTEYCYYNPLTNKLKEEKEANYFATKLLYSNFEIEDGIETKEQLANSIGVNEDIIEYLIKEQI